MNDLFFALFLLFSVISFLSCEKEENHGVIDRRIGQDSILFELTYSLEASGDSSFFLNSYFQSGEVKCRYEMSRAPGKSNYERNGDYFCLAENGDTIEKGHFLSDSIFPWKNEFYSGGRMRYNVSFVTEMIKTETFYYLNGNIKEYIVSYSGELEKARGRVKYALLCDSLVGGLIIKEKGNRFQVVVNKSNSVQGAYQVEILTFLPPFFEDIERSILRIERFSTDYHKIPDRFIVQEVQGYLKFHFPSKFIEESSFLLVEHAKNSLTGNVFVDSVEFDISSY